MEYLLGLLNTVPLLRRQSVLKRSALSDLEATFCSLRRMLQREVLTSTTLAQ